MKVAKLTSEIQPILVNAIMTNIESADNVPLDTLNNYLKPELVTEIVAAADLDLDRNDLICCLGRSDLHTHQIARMLLAEINAGGIMGELYIESLTKALIVHLLRYYTSLPPTTIVLSQPRLQQAIDYIHTHLSGNLSITQIANSVNLSPTYFASLFKRATGMPLHQYVIEQRVARAKILLETTDLPIANIASQAGFSSQSHLTRHCKQLTGMTPRQIALQKVRFYNK
jgi:AraC family transcriptional regulator